MMQKKKETIKSLAIHEKDVGSSEVQVGLLTDLVNPMVECLSFLNFFKCSDNVRILSVDSPT